MLEIIILGAIFYGLFLLVRSDEKNMNGTKNEADKGIVAEKKNPAFHLFLYLVSFLSLGFVVAGIITVYFQVVNKFVSEPAEFSDVISSGLLDQGAVKFGISSLLVASIVYYLVLRLIDSKLRNGEIAPDSTVRKFITYLALFVFSAMAIGSLVALLFNFLDGELTAKFFLKILVFFIVSIFFFSFYFWEIRRKDFPKKPFEVLYFISMLISVSALIWGFMIVDSPRVSREKKIDSELEMRMRRTSNEASSFYFKDKRLPSVEKKELKIEEGVEYKVLDQENYELCGNFRQPKTEPGEFEAQWNHPAGQHCFKINVTKDNSSVIYD